MAQSGRWLVHRTCPALGGKADMAFCDANELAIIIRPFSVLI